MFSGNDDTMVLDEHGTLDLSLRNPKGWTHFDQIPGSPAMEMAVVNIGDPESGPVINLVATEAVDEDLRVPTHFHRSDSFRISLQGELIMSNQRLAPGNFRFQQAGKFYGEGLGGGPDSVWTFLIMGDRRGMAPTLASDEDAPEVLEFVEQAEMGGLADGGPFAEAGRGVPAIATTMGDCVGGFLSGTFDDESGWTTLASGSRAVVGLIGEATTGPVLVLTKSGPDQTVWPACTYGTEVMRVVLRGSSRIGGSTYTRGDVRVQGADSAHDCVVSGPDGLDEIVIVADRRCFTPSLAAADAAAEAWLHDLEALFRAARVPEPA